LTRWQIVAWALGISFSYLPANSLALDIEFVPPPDWVVDHALPAGAGEIQDAPRGKLLFVIQDDQMRHSESSFEQYVHAAMLANSIAAVSQASTFIVPYIPAYQTLNVHYVRVHRGRDVIDKSDSVQIRYTQQAASGTSELDELYTVAALLVGGVTNGDVVEYAVSLSGMNPNLAGMNAGVFTYGGAEIRDLYRRVLVPAGTDLRMRSYGGHPDPIKQEFGEYDDYRWDLGHVEEVEIESNLPSWYIPYPTLEYSSLSGWESLADWGKDKFRSPVKISRGVREKADEIAGHLESPDKRLSAVLRFVQTQIRYVGPGIGRNGYRPYPPEIVLERLYGDCKDKATLMQAVLAALGIESWPALVSTSGDRMIDQRLPSPMLFDHVILIVAVGGNEYWVDPTLITDLPDSQLLQPVYQYGKALVLRDDEWLMREIPVPPTKDGPDHVVYETVFDFTGDLTASLPLTMRWQLIGATAGQVSLILQEYGDEAFEDAVRRLDLRGFDDTEVEVSPTLTDLEEIGGIQVETQYLVDEILKTRDSSLGYHWFFFDDQKIGDELPRARSKTREAPFGLVYPMRFDERISLDVADRFFLARVDELNIDTEYFLFSAIPEWDGKTYSVDYTFETKGDHVPPEAYEDFRADMRRIRARLPMMVLISDSGWPDPEMATEDIADGMSLISMVDLFNRENEELGEGVGEPELTAYEVMEAIRNWDREKIAASDEIYDVFQSVLKHQKVPDNMRMVGSSFLPDGKGDGRRGWWVDLCIEKDYRSMPYCLPVRLD
jgi:transglutaminase-like putative cysteine protease